MDSYGGQPKETGQTSAHCRGEVTAVFEWQRDNIPNPDPAALTDGDPTNDTIPDPLDLPPEEVIPVTRSNASFSQTIMNPSASSPTGSCDNGLQFGPSIQSIPINSFIPPFFFPILLGWHHQGVSEGVTYRKTAGGPVVTIQVAPEAKASSQQGAGASVNCAFGIIVPSVTLLGTTRFTNPHEIQFLTGQQIKATLNPGTFSHDFPAELGVGVSKVPGSERWTIPSAFDPFKNYVATTTLGRRDDHAAGDLDNADLFFYSNRGGEGQVECEFSLAFPQGSKLEGDLPKFRARSKETKSVRPVGSYRVQTGLVSLQMGSKLFFGSVDPGNGQWRPGQKWTEAVATGFGRFAPVGELAFFQLITPNRHYRRTSPDGMFVLKHFSGSDWLNSNGLEFLDAGIPYLFAGETDVRPYSQVWPASLPGEGEDSPWQVLELPDPGIWYESSASDSFKTFLMYKPPSAGGMDSVWVPLSRHDWSWQGTAIRTPLPGGGWSAWVLNSQPPSSTFPKPEEVHPLWNRFLPYGGFKFLPADN
ncbi:MAG: hypothetical protein MH204_07195 [Fimbriimonadaceae bacterium]|nr:hypothetical protein [Fimbriimonadaceae bacterium]